MVILPTPIPHGQNIGGPQKHSPTLGYTGTKFTLATYSPTTNQSTKCRTHTSPFFVTPLVRVGIGSYGYKHGSLSHKRGSFGNSINIIIEHRFVRWPQLPPFLTSRP
jgi:hypothetical protein